MTRHNNKLFILPSVSHYPSRDEWYKACWQRIAKSKKFLNSLITAYERRNLVMRAAIIDRLRSGMRQKDIARELWSSPQTINSVKKAFGEDGYRSYRERGKKERKKKLYSSYAFSNKKKLKPYGRPVRTKYGTIYLP